MSENVLKGYKLCQTHNLLYPPTLSVCPQCIQLPVDNVVSLAAHRLRKAGSQ